MQVSQASVGEILGVRSAQYRIPLYQRTFSWQRKHLERLWEDIQPQADAIEVGNTDHSPHFLGTMVFLRAPDDRTTKPSRFIIDGQQRLTALIVTLLALRDLQKARNNDEVKRINDFLFHSDEGGLEGMRLVPTATDLDSFEVLMFEGEPKSPEHHRRNGIKKSYDIVSNLIRDSDPYRTDTWLASLREAVLDRLHLVEITLNADRSPHAIFESLNDKGMPLAQADLVRNFLFMNLGDQAEKVYHRRWSGLQAQLSSASAGDGEASLGPDEDLLTKRLNRLLWMDLSFEGVEELSMDKVYERTKERFRKSASLQADIESFVDRLRGHAKHYQQMLSPGAGLAPKVCDRLNRLALWKANAIEPTVLFLLDRHERGIISAIEIDKALLMVESFLARRLMVGKGMQGLSGTFQSVPGAIMRADSALDALDLQLAADGKWASDQKLREAVRSVDFYHAGVRRQRKLVLRGIEEELRRVLGTAEIVDLSEPKITIEHLLPQQPDPNSIADLREAAAAMIPRSTWEELHEQRVNLIGNLTLTGINQKLGNLPFHRKRPHLKESLLRMNLEIVENERWGPDQILDRCDRIAKLAIRVWPGPLKRG
jgi:hypothetical protein